MLPDGHKNHGLPIYVKPHLSFFVNLIISPDYILYWILNDELAKPIVSIFGFLYICGFQAMTISISIMGK